MNIILYFRAVVNNTKAFLQKMSKKRYFGSVLYAKRMPKLLIFWFLDAIMVKR